jgi:hypothetical protein
MCEEVTDDIPVEDIAEENTEPKISLHALTGWSTPRTMRIEGRVGNHTLTVLIDSGSTYNFINSKIAEELQLPIIPMGPFIVRVADGNRMKCQGRFEQVQVILQNIPFSLTLYSIPITGLDLVLGVQWLEQLGPVVCNWKKLTMDFWWKNQAQTLNGSNSQAIQPASLTAITKGVCHGCSTFTVYCQSIEKMERPNMQTNMKEIINNFEDIFYEPTQLPPSREVDHSIPLKEGTEPINARPYSYAYFQKTEIEKQVQDMLKLGLIKPSTSPFSSSVLLVKKKDGTWRFCTDFRALNSVTINDRFPIPTIDDMLNELHGAAFFTKLDLREGYHQVRVNPKDTHKTAFRTHNGHYEYMVMPFGLCNTPSTFQAIMNSIFRPHLRQFILVFFFMIF